ncbi:MAG: hemolysin III family protein [Actinobacteria bacterium]|nr:hemolysin III family protein [Actinomycetota bacterium]
MERKPWTLDGHERARIGKMTNPVRGLLHGSAAVVSLVGAILVTVLASGGFERRLSLMIFGLSLVSLYTVSALYHSIPWHEVWKDRMQRLDHTMIHVLVAGTFTPIALIVLDGWLRWVTLAVQWGIVLAGALQKFTREDPSRRLSIALSTTQGWLALILLWPLAQRLPWTALMLIGLGGVFYTGGMVAMITGRPRLWPRVFSAHEVFHVFVIAGSSVHFAAIAGYMARYPSG